MQQHGSKYFARRHTLDPIGVGAKRSKHFFSSESSHVAYQVKGHGAPYKHTFCHKHTLGPGVWSKEILKVVIKGSGAKCTTQAHILSFHTPLTAGVGSKHFKLTCHIVTM